jgi:putative endonuclease
MQSIGKAGEDQAVSFLEKRGYKVLARNYHREHGGLRLAEIDIIAQEKRSAMDRFLGRPATTVFVEVKAGRSQSPELSPEVRVNSDKSDKIAMLAEAWLVQNGVPLESPWRIDVLSIINPQNSQNCQVEHFQNV